FGKRNEIISTPTAGGFYISFGISKDERAAAFHNQVRLHFRTQHAKILRRVDQPLSGKLLSVAYFGDHQIVQLSDDEGHKICVRTGPNKKFEGKEWEFFTLERFGIEEVF